jgi:hypothetical protein
MHVNRFVINNHNIVSIHHIMKTLYVTTFNDVLYEKSGAQLIRSFLEKTTDSDMLVCYEDFEFQSDSSRIMSYNLGLDEFMAAWLTTHKNIIPQCYGGDASEDSDIFKDASRDIWNKDGQVWANHRASRYFRKIVALHYALTQYSDTYDIIFVIDSDCIFKQNIPSELTEQLFENNTSMIYFWSAFRLNHNRGPETGFTGYCKANNGYEFAREICECFASGKFLNYKYWDDGYVIGQIIKEAEQNSVYTLRDLVGNSVHRTTRVMEIKDNLLFDYVHHFKNKHKHSK